jgi:hypothetical protein
VLLKVQQPAKSLRNHNNSNNYKKPLKYFIIMKIQQSLLFLLLLLGCHTLCSAKAGKFPTPPPTKAPFKAPTTNAPTIAPTKVPTKQPSTSSPVPNDAEMKEFDFETFYVMFNSDDESFSIDKKALKAATEKYWKAFIQIQDDVALSNAFISSDVTVVDAVSGRPERSRGLLRRLEGIGAVAELGGVVTFDESATISQEQVVDLQNEAFNSDGYIAALSGLAAASATVSNEIPSSQIPGTQTIGGGGTAGLVIGSFAAIGLVAFAFVKYKRRKTDDSAKSKATYQIPEVVVEEGKDGGIESFEAVMASPTFSIQDTVKPDDSAKKGFEMPWTTKVKSFSKRGRSMSVSRHSGHDDFDTYSLDGSTALGKNPNPGDKMLGQVLAMSNYTPESDISFLNKDASTDRPARVIRVGSKLNGEDGSVYTHSNEFNFDSPSVLGSVTAGVSLASTSMMSESLTTHGRSLTISEKRLASQQNSQKEERKDDEYSVDGIEVTINKQSGYGSDSVNSTDDVWDNVAPPVDQKQKQVNHPPEVAIQNTPTRKLAFAPKRDKQIGVNIVETEQANSRKSELKPMHDNKNKRAGTGITWKQVQRVEKHHKVTITTEASSTSLVRSKFPVQAAAGSNQYSKLHDIPKDRSLLENDSSHDDNSYSSYFSSSDEGDDISALLRGVEGEKTVKQKSQENYVAQTKKNRQNLARNDTAIESRVAVKNGVFPIRTPEQRRISPRSPSSGNSKGNAAISPYKQQEVNETIRSKGISTTNYAANARRNRMARKAESNNVDRFSHEEKGKASISNQVASLRRARLQQRSR